jgi:hypothetical protein
VTAEDTNAAVYDPQRAGKPLLSFFQGARSATLIAPFITVPGIAPLLNTLHASADIVVYTRWLPAEIAAGVSDPAIFGLVDGRGGEIFLEPRLHAKAYINDRAALIGSANLTGKALGFTSEANLEILERVQLPSAPIQALLRILATTGARATQDTADRLIAAAQTAPPVLQETASPPRPWLPKHTVPHQICAAYLDMPIPVDPRLLADDLTAIGAPPGLTHEQFVDHVAGMLLQGLTGRIITDCRGRTPYVAVHRLVELTAEAGIGTPSDAEERNSMWVRLVEWFSHFLGVTKMQGGRSFA